MWQAAVRRLAVCEESDLLKARQASTASPREVDEGVHREDDADDQEDEDEGDHEHDQEVESSPRALPLLPVEPLGRDPILRWSEDSMHELKPL